MHDPDMQPHQASPEATLDALYEALSFEAGDACDWPTFRGLFTPGAQLLQGGERVKAVDVEAFVSDFDVFLASTGCDVAGFSERPTHQRVERYGDVAHAFVTFEARLGASPADQVLRGVDSVQLLRAGGRWWITGLATVFEGADGQLGEGF